MHRDGGSRPAIHFVPPERVRMEPNELHTACGEAAGWADWSTKLAMVSCPRCLAACRSERAAESAARSTTRH
ncbi:MAG TPA: hypothetical protein VFP65_13275 [Anaeromyxobacteraceae bacterium]|nr:hypothetical protein [Anaeromyxobacteraceae bacterium]